MRQRGQTSRWAIVGAAAILVVTGALVLDSGVAACCGGCGGSGEDATSGNGCGGQGRGHGKGAGGGRQMGCGGGMPDHENIHGLLDHHEAVERHVEEVEGGVETVTTSEDPEVTRMIREHVREMKQRVESGHGMRHWDPLFVELFRNYEKIEMEIEDVPGGVRVRETSDDPDVAILIRQHAIRGVSEFVAGGHERAGQRTPMPDLHQPGPAEAGQ